MSMDLFEALRSDRTPLFLAPQAGVSESPFRRLCRRFGADVVVSEFVSADGIVRGNPRSDRYLRFDEAERPIGIQIFGSDPVMMADAAAYVSEVYAPDFVDVNFGCPVKKIVKRNGGSGCLRDLGLVERIVRAVVDATPLPVTTKIRSGFDEPSRDPVGIALRCQEAGSRMVTLHPRTRTDMYSGVARWDEIRALVEALDVPVVGNGDVSTGDDARRMRDETGCHGVMIARGSHGNPWIFRDARAALDGRPVPPPPDIRERFAVCLEHARNAIRYGGRDPEVAAREFRKHLGWYTKGMPGGRAFRSELFQVNSLEEIEARIAGYLERVEEGSLEPVG
ncbi:MAG: tRNA dihydrouridine synthase DusB [Gemmatimonadetes bacterium]|nr:MAG: tRNA dihydrouridine synthase DusB [Gemmatimonadota bacterium]